MEDYFRYPTQLPDLWEGEGGIAEDVKEGKLQVVDCSRQVRNSIWRKPEWSMLRKA